MSNIPGKLTDRFTKGRRFDLTWNILKKIQPSRLLQLGSSIIKFDVNNDKLSDHLIDAYTKLDKGEHLTTLIDYRYDHHQESKSSSELYTTPYNADIQEDNNDHTHKKFCDPSSGLTITIDDDDELR